MSERMNTSLNRRWLAPGITLVVLVALIVLGRLLLGAGTPVRLADAGFQAPHRSAGPPARALDTEPARPNIVFILTDDLSMDLLPYMPNVVAMEQRGLSFSDYFVSDSLCCPSRASIFTGNLPHDTGIFSNTGADGGFQKFHDQGEEQSTFAVALQNAGYRTALMGKYLNEYLQQPHWSGIPENYVPPGWSEWDVAGWGYREYDYDLNENGTLRHFGDKPSDYLTGVVADKAVNFIDGSAGTNTPFFLEVATFAPHSPYTPAPGDVGSFRGLRAPEPPSFNRLPASPPRWLAAHRPLSTAQIQTIDRVFRRRVQSVQAVDRMVGQIESALSADGLAGDTYLVFSSDNGLHAGQYRLMPGKLTAFDTDIRVPLIVDGPGVAAGATTAAISENIDLAPTFAELGGTSLSGDGHSLAPLFSGVTPVDWRSAALVEHHGPDLRGFDPDFQQPASGNPRTYEAMRTARFLYVEYTDGEREFYDLQTDPFELHNLAGQLTSATLTQLHQALEAMENCHGEGSCWASMGEGRELELRIRIRTSRDHRGVAQLVGAAGQGGARRRNWGRRR
jgi:arylsulfatase A-like enzyme